MNENMMPKVEAKKSNIGSIIGIVIILAVLIIAAFYIWGNKIVQAPKETPVQTAEEIIDQTTQDLSDINLNDIDLDIENI